MRPVPLLASARRRIRRRRPALRGWRAGTVRHPRRQAELGLEVGHSRHKLQDQVERGFLSSNSGAWRLIRSLNQAPSGLSEILAATTPPIPASDCGWASRRRARGLRVADFHNSSLSRRRRSLTPRRKPLPILGGPRCRSSRHPRSRLRPYHRP